MLAVRHRFPISAFGMVLNVFAVGSRLRRLVVRMLRQRMTFTTDTSFRRVLWSLRTSGKYDFRFGFWISLSISF